MRDTMLTVVAWRTLIVLTAFNLVSAVGGAVAMLLTDGLGMPTSMLSGSPFASFVWPALLLLVAIGGTQGLAGVLLVGRRSTALAAAAIAGFGMIVWILAETAIIRGFSWLQALYFTTGVAQLALVLILLGIVSWVPRAILNPRRSSPPHGTGPSTLP